MPNLVFDPADEANNQLIHQFEVEYEDVFNLWNLYNEAYRWLRDNEFEDTDTHDSQFETLYHHKIGSEGSVQHRIWWRTEHTPLDSKYFKYFIKVDFRTINMSTVQVERKGKQVQANKGDVIIRVESYLMLDAFRTWRDSSWSYFHSFFKRRFAERINEEQVQVYKLSTDFQATLKNFLEMKNPSPQTEPFHPRDGV